MTTRAWIVLLLVFVAVFGTVAYLTYQAPPSEREHPPSGASGPPAPVGAPPPTRWEVVAHHPRILFDFRELYRPQGLRSHVEAGGTLAVPFDALRAWADAYLRHPTPIQDLPPEIANTRLRALALCHLLTRDDGRFGRLALKLLADGLSEGGRRNPDFDWARFPVTEALVFDWCYDVLDAPLRARLVEDMAKRGTYVADVKKTGAGAHGPLDELAALGYLGMALADETGAADHARRWLALFRKRLFVEVLKPRQLRAADGAAFTLSAREADDEVRIARLVRAWRGASGEDLLALLAHPQGDPRTVYPANALAGWLASTVPDGSSDKYASNPIRNPSAPPALFYELADLGAGDEAAVVGETTYDALWHRERDDPDARLRLALDRLISDRSSGEARAAPAYPAFRAFEEAGLAYVRHPIPDGATLWLAFRATVSPDGAHRHQNHVSLARSGDRLGIDAGYPFAPNRQHIENYFRTPFAHNTVILADLSPDAGHDAFDGYAPGRLAWTVHEDGVAAACGRVGIASSADKAEFTRIVALVLGRYLVIFDTVLMRRAPGNAVWMWHTEAAPELDGTVALLEGKKAGGIIESTDSRQFVVRAGASALVMRTLHPAAPVMRVLGGQRYAFRAGRVNYPPGDAEDEVSEEALREQWAGRYRVEVTHPRPERRLHFVHLGVAGPAGETALPQVAPVQDARALGFYLRDAKHAVELAFSDDGGRMSITIRDRATGATVRECVLGRKERSPKSTGVPE